MPACAVSRARRVLYERMRGKVSRCDGPRERLRFGRTRVSGMSQADRIRAMGGDLVARGSSR